MPAGPRLDFVVIVTPNHQHFGPAKLFLESGFNVVCDKPVTFDLAQAKKLRAIVRRTGKVFVLTHNYTGNAMVKQARELVRERQPRDDPQGGGRVPAGLAGRRASSARARSRPRGAPTRSAAAPRAAWATSARTPRTSRATSPACDIEELCADLTTFVKGRKLDDDGNVLLRFKGGAKGVLHASQICVGDENDLNIRVYGTKAVARVAPGAPERARGEVPGHAARRSGGGATATSATRPPRVRRGSRPAIPRATWRRSATSTARLPRASRPRSRGAGPPRELDFPTIDDGVEGMAFIEAVVRSSRLGARWVKPAAP